MIPTGSLTISPSILNVRGSNTTLTWSSPYATSTILDNGIGTVVNPTTGSITLFVLPPTTFNITFTNSDGSFIASASVTANPDVEVSNADLSIVSQVYRERGAGLIAVNRIRPTGEGYPSYEIRSKNVPVVIYPPVGWMYGISAGYIYILDVTTPSSPTFVKSVSASPIEVGQPHLCFADIDYLYIYSGANQLGCYIFSIADKLNPVYLSQIGSGSAGNIVIRRGLTTYNNLAFVVKGDLSEIQSYNISDMSNPVLISSVPVPFIGTFPSQGGGPRTLAFNEANGRLFMGLQGGNARYGYLDVANDGTLSGGSSFEIFPGFSWPMTGGVLGSYGGTQYYWLGYYGSGAWPGHGLFTTTLGKSSPLLATFFNSTIRPVKYDSTYWVWGYLSSKVGEPAIYIGHPDPISLWIQDGNLGSIGDWTSQICQINNYVYWQSATDKKLYIHDITIPASPVLVGSVLVGLGGGNLLDGLAITGDTGWVGNNGLCTT